MVTIPCVVRMRSLREVVTAHLLVQGIDGAARKEIWGAGRVRAVPGTGRLLRQVARPAYGKDGLRDHFGVKVGRKHNLIVFTKGDHLQVWGVANRSACSAVGRAFRWRSGADIATLNLFVGGQLGPWTSGRTGRPALRWEGPSWSAARALSGRGMPPNGGREALSSPFYRPHAIGTRGAGCKGLGVRACTRHDARRRMPRTCRVARCDGPMRRKRFERRTPILVNIARRSPLVSNEP